MKKLLVIEDNPALLDTYELHVSRFMKDYQFLKAYTGERGIKLAREERPDVVVAEIHLDDMDGLEMLRQIRGKLPRAIIIVLTGVTDSEIEKKAKEIGVDGYFEKSKNIANFQKIVMESVEQRM